MRDKLRHGAITHAETPASARVRTHAHTHTDTPPRWISVILFQFLSSCLVFNKMYIKVFLYTHMLGGGAAT
jgi:hypothetical protein